MDYPDDLPEVPNPPDLATAPKCCTQRTVTLLGRANAKLAQRHYWGAPEWIESYVRGTHVEGFYGNLKNPNTENVVRGWCRAVGLLKTSVTACAVAATNIRLLRRAERVDYVDDPLCVRDDGDHGFEELGPDGSVSIHAPPGCGV